MLCTLAVLATMLAATPAQGCPALQSAYQGLLRSSFTMERDLTVRVDGEETARQIARISYADGKVTREILKQEPPGKEMTIDIEGDPAVKLEFDCKSFVPVANDRYRYRSADGEQEILFALDPQHGALIPVSWTATQTAKFLFIKKKLELIGENKNFQWR